MANILYNIVEITKVAIERSSLEKIYFFSIMGLLNECVCVLQAKGKLVRSTAVCDESLSTEENSKVRIIHKLKTHLQSCIHH